MIKQINEGVWFEMQQPLLLALANTLYGRDLFCIDKEVPRILEIKADSITWRNADGSYTTDFRTHNKWAKTIRNRWVDVQEGFKFFVDKEFSFSFQPVALVSGRRFLEATYYPDAGSGSTTVDGYVGRGGVSESWSSIRNHTDGNGTATAGDPDVAAMLEASVTTDEWATLTRGFFTFDSSALTASATISAAVFSIYGSSKADTLGTSTSQGSILVVSSNPALSNTLGNADYDQIGSTSFGSKTYANYSASAYNDFTMNASGISNVSKTGISKFAVRIGADFFDSTPTWSSGASIILEARFADATGTTNDPKLVVTYTLPSATRKFSASGGASYGGMMMF